MGRRSTSRSTESDVVVGVVRAPHGLKGEVRVEPLTDRFERRFRVGARLLSAIGPLTVASVRGTEAEPTAEESAKEGGRILEGGSYENPRDL